MDQNIQLNENSAEVKSDGEGEPINPSSKKPLNQKVIVLILVAVLLVIVGIVYFIFFNKEDNRQLSPEENVEILEDEEIVDVEIDKNLDSDQDLLPDYLEKILGTNENNSDTDGDSYSDFEEIKNGYNPLTDEKYTEEEWGAVKEGIMGEDEGLYDEVFVNLVVPEGEENTDDVNENKETSDFICGNSTVIDIDSNEYDTVQIGEQCWLKENLKVTKNPAGESITRYCYDNDENICNTDGGLYDWDTAMNNSSNEGAQGICPNGWHIFSDTQWQNLLSRVENVIDLSTGNSIGFEGILVGIRNEDGLFGGRDEISFFWTSTLDEGNVWSRPLGRDFSKIIRLTNDKASGFSVRCLKD